MAWPLGINVATSQPLGIPKALSGTAVTDINPSCSCGRPQTQTQPLAAAQDQTASRSPVASRPPISTPFFTVFVSPDLPLSTGNKHSASLFDTPPICLFTITVSDYLAPQGRLGASSTCPGWHMCVHLCPQGPMALSPIFFFFCFLTTDTAQPILHSPASMVGCVLELETKPLL